MPAQKTRCGVPVPSYVTIIDDGEKSVKFVGEGDDKTWETFHALTYRPNRGGIWAFEKHDGLFVAEVFPNAVDSRERRGR